MRCLLPLLALAACAAPDGEGLTERARAAAAGPETVSSMNFLMEPIDASCAQAAVLDTDGFAARGPVRRSGGAREFTAVFNDDLPVRVIVRRQRDGSSEVSALTKLPRGATPLARREADYAVRAADEAIYRSCTQDGITYGGEDQDGQTVIIETEEKE